MLSFNLQISLEICLDDEQHTTLEQKGGLTLSPGLLLVAQQLSATKPAALGPRGSGRRNASHHPPPSCNMILHLIPKAVILCFSGIISAQDDPSLTERPYVVLQKQNLGETQMFNGKPVKALGLELCHSGRCLVCALLFRLTVKTPRCSDLLRMHHMKCF